MKPGLSKSLRFIFFLAVGVALLLFAFRGLSFKKLMSILSEAHYLWLLLAVLASVLAFFVRARRWIILMEPLGHNPTLVNTYNSVMSGYLANMLFPRLGEITRCAALAKKENMPFEKLVGTVIIERTIDLITVLALMAFMLIYGNSTTGTFFTENIFKPLGTKFSVLFGFSLIIYCLILASFAVIIWLLIRYKKKIASVPFIRKILYFIVGIIDGLRTIASLKRKWEFLLLTALLWCLYLFMAWLPLHCLSSTASLGAGAGLFILVIGSFGMAVPVQSGLGAFHWIVSRGMNIVYGVSVDQGLAYATISHESQLILVLILGGISTFLLFHRKEKKGSQTAQNSAE